MLAKSGRLEMKRIANKRKMIVTMDTEQAGSGEKTRIEFLVHDSKM
jgi:hypothetical protein